MSYFVKIKLPFNWKNEVMKSLRKMNISAASLFPGIAGLGIATEDYIISKSLLSSMTSFVVEQKFPVSTIQEEQTPTKRIDYLIQQMQKIDEQEVQLVGKNFVLKEPHRQVSLFPIGDFQFTHDKTNLFFKIINAADEQVVQQFLTMFELEVVPIANILYDKIEKEGYREGNAADEGVKSWEHIFEIRKSLFDNKIYRIYRRITQQKINA
ncbi:MAG: hypothetical protein IPJ79_18790 [Bacteroidetes bacterium]|nr:hypothetical protein [Bacteroidota bacterium]